MRGLKLKTIGAGEQRTARKDAPDPAFKPPSNRYMQRSIFSGARLKIEELRWDSVRFGKKRRLYYYNKRSRGARCWAYRAVCGYKNFYTKFGLKIHNSDPSRWREGAGSGARASGKEVLEAAHGAKFHFDGRALNMHFSVPEHAAHAHETPMAQFPSVQFLFHGQGHRDTGHGAQGTAHWARDTGHGTPRHSHSHSHHHATDTGHFGWFFQSFWNMAGLNPYAVCISRHKAGEIRLEKAHSAGGHQGASAKAAAAAPHEAGSHKTGIHHHPHPYHPQNMSHPQTGAGAIGVPAPHRRQAWLAKATGHAAGKAPGAQTRVRAADEERLLLRHIVPRPNPIVQPEPERAIRMAAWHREGTGRHEPAAGARSPEHRAQDTAHRTPGTAHRAPAPVRHILSRIPRKLAPKLVVGAEALPE